MVDIRFRHADGHETRVRRVSPRQTKRGAEQYERQIRQQLLDGTWETEVRPPTTVAEFAPKFLGHSRSNNRPSTVGEKETSLDLYIVPLLGRRQLRELDAEHIEAFKSRLLACDLEPKTVNNHLTALRTLLRLAAEWGYMPAVPKIRLLPVRERKVDFLSRGEIDALLDGARPEPMWWRMILLALRTGMRRGELIALRWRDIDLDNGIINVLRSITRGQEGPPKGGHTRQIHVTTELVQILTEARGNLDGRLFMKDDGSDLDGDYCRYPLARACRRAGLRRIGWHVLRHTFASQLVMAGAPIRAVQELLGHTDIRLTMRYSHLGADAKRDAVRLLDRGAELVHPTSPVEPTRGSTRSGRSRGHPRNDG